MNLERQLDLNMSVAKNAAYEYLDDPEAMMADDFDSTEFMEAMNQKSVSEWAVNLQLKNSYTTAKKILDTI